MLNKNFDDNKKNEEIEQLKILNEQLNKKLKQQT